METHKSSEVANTLADEPKIDIADTLSKLDFSQDIENLPVEVAQWTLVGDKPIKKFRDTTFSLRVEAPDMLVTELHFLPWEEHYKIAQKYAAQLEFNPDGSLRKRSHNPVRFVDACSRFNWEGRSYYTQNWDWCFQRPPGTHILPSGCHSFTLTAKMHLNETCDDIKSNQSLLEKDQP